MFAAIAICASCGHGDAPQPTAEPIVTRPALRFDRREQRIDPIGWNHPGIVGAVFCPGDRELLTIEQGGWLRRWNVDDRSQITATALTARDARASKPRAEGGTWESAPPVSVDCDSDGTALAIGQVRRVGDDHGEFSIAYVIARDGTRTKAPLPDSVEQARFAADHSVRMIVSDGDVLSWHAPLIDIVHARSDSQGVQFLAENAVYLGTLVHEPATRGDGLFVQEGDQTIELRPTVDPQLVSVARDGTVVVLDAEDHRAFAWSVNAGRARPRMRLRKETGIKAIAAGHKTFILLAHDETIWIAARPSLTWTHVDQPCQDPGRDKESIVAIALSHDNRHVAVVCERSGVRIISIDDGKLDRGMPSIGATSVAWSDSGKLAIVGIDHSLRLWQGTELERTKPGDGEAVWWVGETARTASTLGGFAAKPGVATSYASSKLVTASARGDVVVFGSDRQGTSGELFVERAGTRTELAAPQNSGAVMKTVALAVSPDGSHIATLRGETDRVASALAVIDVATGAATVQTVSATTVAISGDAIVLATPEGRLVFADKPLPSTDPWAIAAAGPQSEPFGDHGARVTVLRFSPDGKTIAAGGADGRITVWSDRKLLGKLDGHMAPIHGLAWSLDGKQLASTADDGAIVWDLHP